MLLNTCCLIHVTIIILRRILHLVYLCPCLGPGRIYEIYFSFSVLFLLPLMIQPHVNRCTCFLFSRRVLLSFCLIFTSFSLAVLMRVLLVKKACITEKRNFIFKSGRPAVFCKKGVLKKFAKFTG